MATILNKLVDIIVFIWTLIKVGIAAPLLVIGSIFSQIAAFVSEFFCNLGRSPEVGEAAGASSSFFGNLFASIGNYFKYATLDENKDYTPKIIFLFVGLVVSIILSYVFIFQPPKITIAKVSPSTSKALGGFFGFLAIVAVIGFIFYRLNQSEIDMSLANVAQSGLQSGFMFGNQSFFADQYSNIGSKFQQLLGGYGPVLGVVAYTLFTILLFGSIIPDNEKNVDPNKFRIASYILSFLAALFAVLAIVRTFQSSKLGFILGLGFLAFVGYLVYYAYKNPDQGFFTFDNFITCLSILVSLLVFYLVFRSEGIGSTYNVIFERIKMMVLFFCFLALTILYKTSAPGDIINKYFGSMFAMTIILGYFLFFMLAILMITPVVNPTEANSGLGSGLNNLLDVLSQKTWLFYGLFIIFIISVTIGITAQSGDFEKSKNYGAAIASVLVASILFGVFIFWPKTPEFSKNFVDIKNTLSMRKVLLGVTGVAIASLLIPWFISLTQGFEKGSSDTQTSSSVINLLLLLIILAFVYKVIIVEYPTLNDASSWLFDLIFYIPCLISQLIDLIMTTYFGSAKGTIPLLIVLIFILIVYGYSQKHEYKFQFLFGGGKLLIDDSISLRERTVAATYSDLNPDNVFNYRYAISLWAFIDAMPPSTNENYNKFASILSFGGKPDILYNPSENQAIVTMKLKDIDPSQYEILPLNETVFSDDYLDEGESIVIVDRIQKLPLQKWNNFILNCDGGTIDVFLNNELVASKIKMVPYMTYDSLTVGQDNGLFGGVYKVIFHKEPMNINQIRLSYESIVNSIRIP